MTYQSEPTVHLVYQVRDNLTDEEAEALGQVILRAAQMGHLIAQDSPGDAVDSLGAR